MCFKCRVAIENLLAKYSRDMLMDLINNWWSCFVKSMEHVLSLMELYGSSSYSCIFMFPLSRRMGWEEEILSRSLPSLVVLWSLNSSWWPLIMLKVRIWMHMSHTIRFGLTTMMSSIVVVVTNFRAYHNVDSLKWHTQPWGAYIQPCVSKNANKLIFHLLTRSL